MITLCGSCGKPEQSCTCVSIRDTKTPPPRSPEDAKKTAEAIANLFAFAIRLLLSK